MLRLRPCASRGRGRRTIRRPVRRLWRMRPGVSGGRGSDDRATSRERRAKTPNHCRRGGVHDVRGAGVLDRLPAGCAYKNNARFHAHRRGGVPPAGLLDPAGYRARMQLFASTIARCGAQLSPTGEARVPRSTRAPAPVAEPAYSCARHSPRRLPSRSSFGLTRGRGATPARPPRRSRTQAREPRRTRTGCRPDRG